MGLLDLFTSGLDRIKDDGPNLAEERVSLTLSTLDEYAEPPTLARIIAAAQARGTEADLNALAVLARLAPGPAMRDAAAVAARAVQSRHDSGRTGTWLRDLSPVRFTGAWAVGDVFGDRTLITLRAERTGPEPWPAFIEAEISAVGPAPWLVAAMAWQEEPGADPEDPTIIGPRPGVSRPISLSIEEAASQIAQALMGPLPIDEGAAHSLLALAMGEGGQAYRALIAAWLRDAGVAAESGAHQPSSQPSSPLADAPVPAGAAPGDGVGESTDRAGESDGGADGNVEALTAGVAAGPESDRAPTGPRLAAFRESPEARDLATRWPGEWERWAAVISGIESGLPPSLTARLTPTYVCAIGHHVATAQKDDVIESPSAQARATQQVLAQLTGEEPAPGPGMDAAAAWIRWRAGAAAPEAGTVPGVSSPGEPAGEQAEGGPAGALEPEAIETLLGLLERFPQPMDELAERLEELYLPDDPGDGDYSEIFARRLTAFPGLANRGPGRGFDAENPAVRIGEICDSNPDLFEECIEQVQELDRSRLAGQAGGGAQLVPAALELARREQVAWNLWRGRPRSLVRNYFLLAAGLAARQPGEETAAEASDAAAGPAGFLTRRDLMARLAASVPRTPALEETASVIQDVARRAHDELGM